MDDPTRRTLAPAQERTLEMLRRGPEPIVFDPDAIEALSTTMTDALEHLAERVAALGRDSLWINKSKIGSVLGCEVHHTLPDDFSWNVARATGTVAHRAIELLINWRGEPIPADLVDESIARLIADQRSIGEWLAGITEADRAELTGGAVDRVVKFTETFPPLDRRFAPVVESSIRWPNDGPIVLAGKVDLVIGRAEGRESRKVIIDLKTGGVWPNHMDELRFYALLETLRSGIPPRKIASFYLDSGRAVAEDVTVDSLRSAVRRTLDAVGAEVELREGRTPEKRPQASCNWCPLVRDCAEGTEWLRQRAEERDA